MPYATQGVAAQVRNRTKPATRPPKKPALGADVIQSAMDKRPRLNANMRRAPAGVKPAVMAETPDYNPTAQKPAWQQLRERGQATTGSAAGNRAALGEPMTDILTAAPPATGGIDPNGMPPPKEPFGGGPPPGLPYAAADMAGGADPMTFNAEPLPFPGDDPSAMNSFPAPSGSQNPMFSANLPPHIMQRLQALQRGRGGGQGALGAQPPGAPAGVMSATLPDYYQPPVLPRGQRPMQPTFDRRMAY